MRWGIIQNSTNLSWRMGGFMFPPSPTSLRYTDYFPRNRINPIAQCRSTICNELSQSGGDTHPESRIRSEMRHPNRPWRVCGEVEYWSKKFGVTPDQLKAAVSRVGSSAAKVEQELKRR